MIKATPIHCTRDGRLTIRVRLRWWAPFALAWRAWRHLKGLPPFKRIRAAVIVAAQAAREAFRQIGATRP